MRCTNLEEFQQAFAKALTNQGPTLIDCVMDCDERVLPMIPAGKSVRNIVIY